jgi:hypothetical protein
MANKTEQAQAVNTETLAALADLLSLGSLRVHVRGLEIDIQSRESGVIHLVIRAHEQDRSLVGRLRKYLADALFSAGDLCHTGNHQEAVRVVKFSVAKHAVDDGLANRRNHDATQIRPLHTSNGDAHYQALVVYEGVKKHGDMLFPFHEVTRFGAQECADDAQGNLQELCGDWLKNAVVILPDTEEVPA